MIGLVQASINASVCSSVIPYPFRCCKIDFSWYDAGMSKLIPQDLLEKLISNSHDVASNRVTDPAPVVKLHMPSLHVENKPTWLIIEVDSFYYNDIAFGLCDPGLGFPELGEFSISELEDYVHPVSGKKLLERDENFVAAYPISVYAEAARMCQHITEDPQQLAIAAKTLNVSPL